MNTTFDHIILRTELVQSETFGDFYGEILDSNEGSSFCNPLIEDVSELLENILLKYESLTSFQKDMLHKIFSEFNNIRTTIDPKRLKSFTDDLNEDEELLLFRESQNGLINLIINPEDCVAFSFIPNNEQQRKFYFIDRNGDFEILAYNFFSN
jgi:hypothetical protein